MKNFFCLSLFAFSIFGVPHYSNAQIITTIAGNGTAGIMGDGGPATNAEFNFPVSLGSDNFGNIFVADRGNNRIRKISTTGVITTIAGNGVAGFSGDGGQATAASLNMPTCVCFDTAGNLYFGDWGNNRIRKINTAGLITTIAGNGIAGYSGDGGSAIAAHISDPIALIFDSDGNLIFSDHLENCIRKINNYGVITTIAGTGTAGFSGDGGPATSAHIDNPLGLAFDNAHNLYFTDEFNFRIRKINASGIISTIAGTGINSFSGDGGPATAATMSFPLNLAIDAHNNLYFSDCGTNHRIRKIDSTGIITTFGGNGGSGYSGDGGPATVAMIASPWGVLLDTAGDVYLCDELSNVVRKITVGDASPSFNGGSSQSKSICNNEVSISLDSLLTVTDPNIGQTETWSLVSGPHHGISLVAFTTVSTGGILVPTGLTYTPGSGYYGYDTFIVRIGDGLAFNNTTIVVNILNCALMALENKVIESNGISVYPDPSNGTFTIKLSSDLHEDIRFIILNSIGEKLKEFNGQTNTGISVNTDLPDGIYYISAITSADVFTKKLLKISAW